MNKYTLSIAALTVSILATSAHAASISGQGTWETTLQARDLTGNGIADAYYDSTINITWLADANAAAGSDYETAAPGTGLLSWFEANLWAADLTIGNAFNWRLPNTLEPDPSCSPRTGNDHFVNCTGSEMGNLFYNVLGNTAEYLSHIQNTGPFTNVQSGWYWSSALYMQGNGMAWIFNMHAGDQNYFGIDGKIHAWAVHDGDVGVAIPSEVPIPAAVWLFGSGLLGLLAMARKHRS